MTNNVITSQVSAGIVKGLFPQSKDIQVDIQSSNFDSLEPAYSCSGASSIKNNITADPAWTGHLNASVSLYARLDAISGTSPNDTAGWHVSFDQ